MRYLWILFFLVSFNGDQLVTWKNQATKKVKAGDNVELNFKGKVEKGWYMYSSALETKGPMETRINWNKNDSFEVIEGLQAVGVSSRFDEIWGGDIQYFEKEAHYIQKVKIIKPGAQISGTLRYQVCINDPEDGRCVNEEQPFSFEF